MKFGEAGFQIFKDCVSLQEIEEAKETVESLCSSIAPGHPLWDHVVPLSVLAEGRNPGVEDRDLLAKTPFLLAPLPELSPCFGRLITSERLWATAAEVLESDRIVYHFSNVTRKPAAVGPNMTWHRDYPNGYICPKKSDFFRALIPLEGMDEENGCTQVIPGTHFISDELAADKEKRQNFDIERAIPIILAPGEMVAIHSKLVHGGGPNRSQRERNVVVIQFGIQTDDYLWKHDEPYFGLNREEILNHSTE